MAITYTVMDARTEKLVDLLTAATYLGDGLSTHPKVHKGVWQAPQGPTQPASVFVARQGLPKLEYGIAGEPVLVTQAMVVACQIVRPLTSEQMEEGLSYLTANVLRCLLANASATGASGWYAGIVTETDAVTLRSKEHGTTAEMEIVGFEIRYEVDRT